MAISVEPRAWSRGRWWIAVGILFAVQLALLFSLEDRSPVVPRKTVPAPAFHVGAGRLGDLLAVKDPTLFALPHRRGFSGSAWLAPPAVEFHSPDWSEPDRPLLLDADALGKCFELFIRTNPAPASPTVVVVEPDAANHEAFSIIPPLSPSSLRLEGGLAGRRLRSLPPLPSWTNTDLMTNSVVQVVVDARGDALSAVLLTPGGGPNKEAGRCALELSKAARFESLNPGAAAAEDPEAGLSIGAMIFEWQAVIAPPAAPPPGTP